MYSLDKQSRFLDTTLKISELEQKEEIYDKKRQKFIIRQQNKLDNDDDAFSDGSQSESSQDMSDSENMIMLSSDDENGGKVVL